MSGVRSSCDALATSSRRAGSSFLRSDSVAPRVSASESSTCASSPTSSRPLTPQLERERGQRDQPTMDPDPMRRSVDPEGTELDQRGRRITVRVAASEKCLDAKHQLANAEWLDHVIVSTQSSPSTRSVSPPRAVMMIGSRSVAAQSSTPHKSGCRGRAASDPAARNRGIDGERGRAPHAPDATPAPRAGPAFRLYDRTL